MPARIVQRTPDLGLTLRLQTGCKPSIGRAAWYNHRTNAYDLTTVEAKLPYSSGDIEIDGRATLLAAARVTGDLCAATVQWAIRWHPAVTGSPAPSILTPDRALAVAMVKDQRVGVLTATATAIIDGQPTALAPIYLVIVQGEYEG